MVSEVARRAGREERKVLEEVLDAVWRNFDYVGEGRTRKAVAMGVGALLTTVSGYFALILVESVPLIALERDEG